MERSSQNFRDSIRGQYDGKMNNVLEITFSIERKNFRVDKLRMWSDQ